MAETSTTVGATEAARILGCSRSCVYRLLKRVTEDLPSSHGSAAAPLSLEAPLLGARKPRHGRWRFKVDALKAFIDWLLPDWGAPTPPHQGRSDRTWISSPEAAQRRDLSLTSFHREVGDLVEIKLYEPRGRQAVEFRVVAEIGGVKLPDGNWQFLASAISAVSERERLGKTSPGKVLKTGSSSARAGTKSS